MLSKHIQCLGLLILVAVALPASSRAECVTVPAGKIRGATVAQPTLVFSGTVTEVDIERLTVSFDVDRVWTGRLRKATTLVVASSLEGATVRSFKSGVAYLVRYFGEVHRYAAGDPYFPNGSLGVAFSCGDGPIPWSEASAGLKRLGRGRVPLP